jgi:hypothetical protein
MELAELGSFSQAAFVRHEGLLARAAGSDTWPRRAPGRVSSVLQIHREPPRKQPVPGDVRLGRLDVHHRAVEGQDDRPLEKGWTARSMTRPARRSRSSSADCGAELVLRSGWFPQADWCPLTPDSRMLAVRVAVSIRPLLLTYR